VRRDLKRLEKDWQAERDALVKMLVDGAEIERGEGPIGGRGLF